MMKILILRHAETEENKKGLVQGHQPGTLTKKGMWQAKQIAECLSQESLDYVYSSDLKRARECTREILKVRKIPVNYTSLLRGRCRGSEEGKNKGEEKEVPDGESWHDCRKRARRFLTQIFSKHQGQDIACMGHTGINNPLISELMGEEWTERLPNASITEFFIDSVGKIKKGRWGNIDHLQDGKTFKKTLAFSKP